MADSIICDQFTMRKTLFMTEKPKKIASIKIKSHDRNEHEIVIVTNF